VSELEFNVPFQHKHGYIRDVTKFAQTWTWRPEYKISQFSL